MPGRTQVIANNSALQPFALYATTPGMGAVRSVTIANNSSQSTVYAYIGSDPSGSPFMVVPPGATQTLPCQASNVIAFSFSQASNDDGTFTLHIDDQVLSAASGTISIFSGIVSANGWVTLSGTLKLSWQSAAGTFANDGTCALTIAFAAPFANAPLQYFGTPSQTQVPDSVISATMDDASVTSAQITVYLAGGNPGENVSFRCFAIGA